MRYYIFHPLQEPTALRIVAHNRIPEDAEFCRQWNAVALATGRPEIFYTAEWAMAMQSAYPHSLKPLLFLAYEADGLIGVASLASDLSGKHISFLAANTADYCDFLTPPEHRERFLDLLFNEIAALQPRRITLANLPADSPTAAILARVGSKTALGTKTESGKKAQTGNNHPFFVFQRPAYACAQVELGEGKSEARRKLKSSVSRKQMFQRKLRGLERAGAVTMEHLRSWDAIQPALEPFADTHAARFRLAGRVSSLAASERRHFLEELAKRFGNSGAVTLSILKLNDRPIAWNYGFRFSGSWFWYQPTFASDMEEHSPGYCLLAKIIMEACDVPDLCRVDLGLGDEGYKLRFATGFRNTLHLSMTASPSLHLREMARYRAAAALKRSPKIEAAIRRLLGR